MVVYRAAAHHTPLRIAPDVIGGRFHRAGRGPVQYFCEHPLGPLAEALRRLPDGIDAAELRRPVWALRLSDGTRVETIGFDEAERWGIEPQALVGPPGRSGACQDLGETLLRAGDPPVLRVPSAALPGTWDVVAFGPRVLAPYGAEPADPLLDVPGAPVAVDARAWRELAALVRPLHQDAHAAYDAWVRGQPYAFPEPQALSLVR